MIYLIGGPPRIGKSTVAKQLSEKLSIPYFETDDIQKEIRANIPTEEWGKLLPFRAMQEQSHFNNDILFANHSSEAIVTAYIQQSVVYWPEMKKRIEQFLSEQVCILEGHILHPKFVEGLNSKEIKSVFLRNKNVTDISEKLQKGIEQDDWVITRTHNSETFPKIAKVIVEYSDYIQNQATAYNFTSIDMCGDFEEHVHAVIEFLSTV